MRKRQLPHRLIMTANTVSDVTRPSILVLQTGFAHTLSISDNEVDQEARMSEFALEKNNADDSESDRHDTSNNG